MMRKHKIELQRSSRVCSNWAGLTAATCKSTIAAAQGIPVPRGDMLMNWSRRAGRHSGLWRHGCGGVAAGDPHRANRVHADPRSGRCWLRRKLGAAGRQCHRVYHLRIRHQREMAGAAQGDSAGRDPSGCPSRSHHTQRDWPIRLNPVRGTFVRSGIEPAQCARRQRNRARRRRIRARIESRIDRYVERVGGSSSPN